MTAHCHKNSKDAEYFEGAVATGNLIMSKCQNINHKNSWSRIKIKTAKTKDKSRAPIFTKADILNTLLAASTNQAIVDMDNTQIDWSIVINIAVNVYCSALRACSDQIITNNNNGDIKNDINITIDNYYLHCDNSHGIGIMKKDPIWRRISTGIDPIILLDIYTLRQPNAAKKTSALSLKIGEIMGVTNSANKKYNTDLKTTDTGPTEAH